MNNKILYLTCANFDFSHINPTSALVTSVDHDFSNGAEFHTSISDLSPVGILSIIHQFNRVMLVETGFDKSSKSYVETKKLISYINKIHASKTQLTPGNEKVFVDNKSIFEISQSPTLWVFGCSHSFGTGLLSEDQRYANILSNDLRMPLNLIAKPGSSMNYSLRHIINSNFGPNDLIIWQIINPARLSRFNGVSVEEILLSNTTDRSVIDFHSDYQIYFNHFTLINIGVRYLRSLGNKFILTSMDHSDQFEYLFEYKNYPEYVFFPDFVVDHGTDGKHFGPLSHKNLALSLLNHIQYKHG